MRCAHIWADEPKNRERNRVGNQCGNHAVNGTKFCKFHGGNSGHVIDKARRDLYEQEVSEHVERAVGFTDLWAEDHAMLDPFSLLLWEIRRSGARIEWFDVQLDKLKDERSLWWGITKRERIGASEFAGTNKTYEARENILVKMQNEERKRLKELRDEWQNNRFEAAKIAGYGAFRTSMRAAIGALLSAFDLDPTDPEVQATLRTALEALPEPIPALDAPDGQDHSVVRR